MSEFVPVEEQIGPPPLVEELFDTNDLPVGMDVPPQTPESLADFDELANEAEENPDGSS